MIGIIGSAAATILSLHGWPVYLVVALLAFGESALFLGFVLPGETAMVIAGVLAARGNISLPAIIAICATAAVLGDQVGYLIGRHFGPGLRGSRLGRRVGERRWAKAQYAVTRHGAWAVAGGRWVAVLRALVPTVAGVIAMPYRRFLLANAVGGSVWAAGAVLVGYFAGGSVSTAQDLLGRTSLIGLTLVSVLAVVSVVTYLRRRRRAGQEGQRASRPDPEGQDADHGTGWQPASRAPSDPGPSADRHAAVGS
ncbi:MAG: DedA family protein [Terracoccus sp.]